MSTGRRMHRVKGACRIALAVVLSAFLLVATGCQETGTNAYSSVSTNESATSLDARYDYGSDDTWTICWYLCGSNLESGAGAATDDLVEMSKVKLPSNVRVVIETGGSSRWENNLVNPRRIQRWVYDSNGLQQVDELRQANMGDAGTLADFLGFCQQQYPADHTALVFWDHGGGSISGVSYDENYQFDSLTLDELSRAFESCYGKNPSTPPLEMIGFDTCLMATIDTASTCAPYARYLVASQETEPACGWEYSGWLSALASNPGMGGAQLGCTICDTYMQGCKRIWVAGDATLSVTDLTALGPLMNAYRSFGDEALLRAANDSRFFSTFSRCAMQTENYGGNTKSEGFTDMCDLGSLVRNCSTILPDNTQAVLQALQKCVIYRVNGDYRSEASGLSCYYPYSTDMKYLAQYARVSPTEAFPYLYAYELTGNLGDSGRAYISNITSGAMTEAVEVPTVESTLGSGPLKVTVDDDGYATVDIGAAAAASVATVHYELAYMDEARDLLVSLGMSDDVDTANWETGVYRDDFQGVWGGLDGHLAYMELSYESDEYNMYSVPIKLNGGNYTLRVVYDNRKRTFEILGAVEDTGSETTMTDKNLRQLAPGDQVTMVLYTASFSGNDDFVPTDSDAFTVTESTAFDFIDLPDRSYIMLFELQDAAGNSVWSEPVHFDLQGDAVEVWTDSE